jgi:Fe(II)/alpha-ketoglutarate-dependent arginine beta-hydroxylase
MNRIVLNKAEMKEIESLLQSLVRQYSSAEDAEFLRRANVYAHALPERLRIGLNDFKTLEVHSTCLISGYPIDQDKIGYTPAHWKNNPDRWKVLEEEMLLVLMGALLGDLFGWATQQDGRIVHDVMPIKGNENEQLGTGSEQLLWWHNEDAFHPYRGDYLGMMCLRNPDKIPTTIGSIDQISIGETEVELLFQPRYTIRPDESHLVKNTERRLNEPVESEVELTSAYHRIRKMNIAPEKLSVLFGNPQSPYLRLDPYFMDQLEDDPEAQEALNAIINSMDQTIHDLALEPGDFVFVDNYRAVHGRKPFNARYDGQDRWMKRINITRDLRKSRDARLSCTDRLIY